MTDLANVPSHDDEGNIHVVDAPTWPGVVIPCRPIGIVLVTQRETEKAKRVNNHRIIAVPKDDERYTHVNDLTKRTHEELERFFVSVGQMTHKEVEVNGWAGPKRARAEIEKSTRRYAKHGQKE